MEPLTDEQQADIIKRTGEFKTRYSALVEELGIDFVFMPKYVPQEGGFVTVPDVQLMDKRLTPTPSPISAEATG